MLIFHTIIQALVAVSLAQLLVASDPLEYLILANGVYIHQLSLDLARLRTIVTSQLENVTAIDYHYRQGHIYWSDVAKKTIMRSNLDGSMITTILDHGLHTPVVTEGLAVDWITDKLYWTDAGLNKIGVLDLQTGYYKTVIDTGNNTEPRAIAVDPITKTMYWSSAGVVEKASMDGKNRTVIHNTGLMQPNSLEIDYSSQMLYWTDESSQTIERSNVDGSGRTPVANSSDGDPLGITLHEDTLYFSTGFTVQSISFAAGSVNHDHTLDYRFLCSETFGLKFVGESKQPLSFNPCGNNNGGCSHLCLLSSEDLRGFSCGCPDELVLSTNMTNCLAAQNTLSEVQPLSYTHGSCRASGFTSCCSTGLCKVTSSAGICYCDKNCQLFGDCCIDVPVDCSVQESTPFIAFTARLFIHSLSLNGETVPRIKTLISESSDTSYISGLDYHYRHGFMFWADFNESKIWQSNIDGSGKNLVVNTALSGQDPGFIAVDWISNKIYWTSFSPRINMLVYNTIEVYDIQHCYHKELVQLGRYSPSYYYSLVIDPRNRNLYWSTSSTIEKASMDGTNQSTLHQGLNPDTRGLAVDHLNEILYWVSSNRTSAQYFNVESSNLDGSNRRTIAVLETHNHLVLSIAFYNGSLFYTSTATNTGSENEIHAIEVSNTSRLTTHASFHNLKCDIRMYSIIIITDQQQLQGPNPCGSNNGGCSELCLFSSTDAKGYSCDCQDGKILHQNGRDCIVGGCEPNEFEGYQWPKTSLGSYAGVPCPCEAIVGSLAGQVYRLCEGTNFNRAEWSNNLSFSECIALNREVSMTLCTLAELMIMSNDTVTVAETLANLTSEADNLVAADISASVFVLDRLTNKAASNPVVREYYLQAIDNIQHANREEVYTSQYQTQSSSRVLNSLGRFLDAVEFPENGTENKTAFGFQNFALQVQDIDPERFNGQTFIVDLGSVEEALNNSERIDTDNLVTAETVLNMLDNATASIQVPKRLLNCVDGANETSGVTQRLSYLVFLTDILFQAVSNGSSYVTGSIITGIQLGPTFNETLLTTINTTFQINNEVAENARSCVSWDASGFGSWSNSECREVSSNGNTVTCSCKQLAHFAVLFDRNPSYIPGTAGLLLSVFSYVGLVVSLVCLILFIITYIGSKKLCTSTHGQILINMSVALIGLYIFFLIGGHVASVRPLCGISSALLQYFVLVYFAWTVVEAVWLFLNIVKVIGVQKYTLNYILKAGLPSWLVPTVVVVLSAGPGYKFYIKEFYCRATEWPFWFGMILPFLLMYAVDLILFIMILTAVCKHSHRTRKRKGESNAIKTSWDSAVAAITLATVLGIGWGFGLVATSLPVKELTFAFQIVFSLFVGLQGFLIFILHGVKNADARKLWKNWSNIILKKSHLHYAQSSVSNDNGKSTQNRDALQNSGMSFLPHKGI